MKKVIDFNTIPRPINLNNRKEKLEKRSREIRETHENLKKRAQEIFKRK